MALVTTMVVLALMVAVVRWYAMPSRLRTAQVDSELAAMLNQGVAELIEERLGTRAELVRVRAGRRLLQPFLDIQLDTTRLHLRLYRDTRGPTVDGRSLARLTGLRLVDGLGWIVTFDSPRGAERYLGWLLETTTARRTAA
jgi:hypothetical protein